MFGNEWDDTPRQMLIKVSSGIINTCDVNDERYGTDIKFNTVKGTPIHLYKLLSV